MTNISNRLRQARESLGLTQQQIADRAGVSQGTIGNIESGARQRPRELLKIARALNVDPGWLLGDQAAPVAHESSQPLVYAGRTTTAERAPTIGAVRMSKDASFSSVDLLPPTGSVPAPFGSPSVYGFRVLGDALYPYAAHGCCLLVDPSKAPEVGEMALVALTDGRRLVRELSVHRADALVLHHVIDGSRETVEASSVESILPIISVVAASQWRAD